MNVDEQVNILRKRVVDLRAQIKWLKNHGKKLAEVNGQVIPIYDNQFDLDNLPHKEVVKLIRALGGKWKKSASATANRINYETMVDGMIVRCWAGEPPPSCKIVEVEELVPEKVIPAHTRKVTKMICQGNGTDPLAMAIAQKTTTS